MYGINVIICILFYDLISGKKLGRQQKHHVGNFERAKYHPIVHEMGPSKEKQKLQKD